MACVTCSFYLSTFYVAPLCAQALGSCSECAAHAIPHGQPHYQNFLSQYVQLYQRRHMAFFKGQ